MGAKEAGVRAGLTGPRLSEAGLGPLQRLECGLGGSGLASLFEPGAGRGCGAARPGASAACVEEDAGAEAYGAAGLGQEREAVLGLPRLCLSSRERGKGKGGGEGSNESNDRAYISGWQFSESAAASQWRRV